MVWHYGVAHDTDCVVALHGSCGGITRIMWWDYMNRVVASNGLRCDTRTVWWSVTPRISTSGYALMLDSPKLLSDVNKDAGDVCEQYSTTSGGHDMAFVVGTTCLV